MSRLELRYTNDNEKVILDYLEENASEELVKKINRNKDKKGLGSCWAYIMEEAKKKLNNKSGYVDPKIVFGWAVHFFEEDSIKPENVKKDSTNNITKKPVTGAGTKAPEKMHTEIVRMSEQKKPEPKAEAPKPKKEKPVIEDNQISLFDLFGGE